MSFKIESLKIIVGGPGGTGSTSVAQFLAKSFNLYYIYGGQIMRRFAKEQGFKELADFFQDPEAQKIDWDEKVENEIRRQLLTRDKIVVEGKVWAGIATLEGINVDFKVWITADFNTRVRRLLERKHGIPLNKSLTAEEMQIFEKEATLLKERYYSDKKRYWRKYGVHYDRPALYNDLVLDTTNIPLEKVKEIVSEHIKKKVGLF